MEPRPSVLIASSSFDHVTTTPVARELDALGCDVINYRADAVVRGEAELLIDFKDGRATARYDGRPLPLGQELGAAWYRRPSDFVADEHKVPDLTHYESFAAEYRSAQAGLWGLISNEAWLNSPTSMRLAGQKLRQLVVAAEVGFDTPPTVISNTWEPIRDLSADTIIYKTHHGVMQTKDDAIVVHTNVVPNDPDSLPLEASPYPGIWQPYVPKEREWRITIAGEASFDAAIYTEGVARSDWRKYQWREGMVRFEAAKFPDEDKARCFRFMGALGLRFAIFEFVESPDGQLTFLEVNVNGQYGWLEKQLGMPISAAIASELNRIARRDR